eukprot:TRINITY_DN12554_c0_g1_i2.p3 TRINITY_DN12554_c0_g1~~TRINITY_DN12554_c0_g1_i2.p3  ORF type:complete len:111 (+),score=7.56 TRINITY_DN12554_c0_g1_i2:2362-2694(+)
MPFLKHLRSLGEPTTKEESDNKLIVVAYKPIGKVMMREGFVSLMHPQIGEEDLVVKVFRQVKPGVMSSDGSSWFPLYQYTGKPLYQGRPPYVVAYTEEGDRAGYVPLPSR